MKHTTFLGDGANLAWHTLRLLQTWQTQGRLQSLRQLNLNDGQEESEDFLPDGNPSPLSYGVISLAGLWNLFTCRVYCPFSLEAATNLLPTSLLAVSMWPDSAPGVIRLSAFKMFPNLQMLNLAVGSGDGEEGTPAIVHFLLDTAFPCLKYVSIHDRLHCRLAQNITVAACFPNVHTLHVRVNSSQGSRILVDGLLASQHLKIFQLDVLEEDGLQWADISKVQLYSEIVCHSISKQTHDDCSTAKADMQYKCSGVDTVNSASILGTLPSSYYQRTLFSGNGL